MELAGLIFSLKTQLKSSATILTHQFAYTGTSKPGASLELERHTHTEGGEGAGSCLTYNPHMNLTISQQRQRLPIFKVTWNLVKGKES